MIYLLFRGVTLLLLTITVFVQSTKIEPNIFNIFSQDPDTRIDLLISVENGDTEPILKDLNRRLFRERTPKFIRPQAVYSELKNFAKQTQGPIIEQIRHFSTGKDGGAIVKSFWIVNKIFVGGASRSLIEKISQMPNVGKIEQDNVMTFSDFEPSFPSRLEMSRNGRAEIQWGVEYVRAPEAWAMGYEGQGVIIGIMDTGVNHYHESLESNWVGADKNGWFSPKDLEPEPYDNHGHGSHVTGTAVGLNGIGVAPKAKWLACKMLAFRTGGYRANEAPRSMAFICGQYMICPNKPDGTEPDCSLAPHIINNSWGRAQRLENLDVFREMIQAWKTSGVIPVFGAGNEGHELGCGSMVLTPQNHDVITVGAIDYNNSLAYFSSRGPKYNPQDTTGWNDGFGGPTIVAPGDYITSAGEAKKDEYVSMSGTSMASPHVVGVIALLLSKEQSLSLADVNLLLTKTASHDLKSSNESCEGLSDTEFPNYQFGYGLVDALEALKALP